MVVRPGFKTLENVSYIIKPDQIKIRPLIVFKRVCKCDFLSFCNFNFSVCPVSTAIFPKKCHATFLKKNKTETDTSENNEQSNFYLIWFDYVSNFFKSFETRQPDHCASCLTSWNLLEVTLSLKEWSSGDKRKHIICLLYCVKM